MAVLHFAQSQQTAGQRAPDSLAKWVGCLPRDSSLRSAGARATPQEQIARRAGPRFQPAVPSAPAGDAGTIRRLRRFTAH
jgi:hypothetical protein